MPIYEYVCNECTQEFEVLVRGSEQAMCPSCDSQKLTKLMSVPATHATATESFAGCNMPSPQPCGRGGCGLPQCDV